MRHMGMMLLLQLLLLQLRRWRLRYSGRAGVGGQREGRNAMNGGAQVDTDQSEASGGGQCV